MASKSKRRAPTLKLRRKHTGTTLLKLAAPMALVFIIRLCFYKQIAPLALVVTNE